MSADPRPEPIVLREVRDEDLPQVFDIARTCSEPHQRFSESVIEYMAMQSSCGFFVAERGGVVGFVVVHKLRGQTGEIVAIDVASGSRDLDIGTDLLLRGEEWLAGNGAKTIFLEVDATNAAARALYTKLGYVPRETFDENGSVRYLMQKLVDGVASPRLHIRK